MVRLLLCVVVLFSFLTLLLIGSGPKILGQEQEQFLTFRDPKDMFTIQYPNSWEKKDNQSGGVSFYIPESRAVFSIYVQPLQKLEDLYNRKLSSLEQLVDLNIQRLQNWNFANRLIPGGVTSMTISNQSAFRAESEPGPGLSPGSRDKMLHIWSLIGDAAYTFTFSAREPIYLEYLPTVNKMIGSFKPLKIPATAPQITQVIDNPADVQSLNKITTSHLTGWKTFSDGNLSIQLRYPPDWIVSHFESADGQINGIRLVSNSTTASEAPFFMVNATDRKNNGNTISQLVDSVTTSFENITQENLVTLSGLPAFEVVYLKQVPGEEENEQFEFTDLIANSKNNTYHIRYGANADERQAFSTFKNLLATIKIGDGSFGNETSSERLSSFIPQQSSAASPPPPPQQSVIPQSLPPQSQQTTPPTTSIPFNPLPQNPSNPTTPIQPPQTTQPEKPTPTILSHNSYYDNLGSLHIVGEIVNESTEEMPLVQVIASFYDASNRIIGTRNTYTNPMNLQPGQRAPFEITIYQGSIPTHLMTSYALSADYLDFSFGR
jgi:hypothetical protein